MPCYDPRSDEIDEENVAGMARKIAWLEAALCACVPFALSKDQTLFDMDKQDWAETGISFGNLITWWQEHQEKDAARRAP